jgi:hypothetical protein
VSLCVFITSKVQKDIVVARHVFCCSRYNENKKMNGETRMNLGVKRDDAEK